MTSDPGSKKLRTTLALTMRPGDAFEIPSLGIRIEYAYPKGSASLVRFTMPPEIRGLMVPLVKPKKPV